MAPFSSAVTLFIGNTPNPASTQNEEGDGARPAPRNCGVWRGYAWRCSWRCCARIARSRSRSRSLRGCRMMIGGTPGTMGTPASRSTGSVAGFGRLQQRVGEAGRRRRPVGAEPRLPRAADGGRDLRDGGFAAVESFGA